MRATLGVLNSDSIWKVRQDTVACTRCPRLISHCTTVASQKRRAFRDWEYWGKPVPSFGDADARLLIIGLAPAAHGANRTGRMFTGDSSGNLLYRVLHATGFSSQAESTRADDGLQLYDAFITASVRCAPPDNKPSREEIATCRIYLEREIDLLTNVRVVVVLGRLAFDVYLSILRDQGKIRSRSPFVFEHGGAMAIGPGSPMLLTSYHPSQQNTSTGKLTEPMFRHVFETARRLLG
jgi:uracil-DNA glycosylase family 4